MVWRGIWRGALKIGIFSEDKKSGKKILYILAKKILGERAKIIPVFAPRGDLLRNPEKLKAYINLMVQLNRGDKIIVCVDKHCEEGFNERLQSLQADIGQDVTTPIYCIPVVDEIESWLLDEEALSKTLGQRVRVYGDPEAHGAFKKIKRIFNKVGENYIKTRDASQIAVHIKLDNLRSRSSSFEAFYRRARDP